MVSLFRLCEPWEVNPFTGFRLERLVMDLNSPTC